MTMQDEPFDWEALEKEFQSLPPSDVVVVTELTDIDLLERYQRITKDLARRGERLRPKTEESRSLHSERAACFLELKRRELL